MEPETIVGLGIAAILAMFAWVKIDLVNLATSVRGIRSKTDKWAPFVDGWVDGTANRAVQKALASPGAKPNPFDLPPDIKRKIDAELAEMDADRSPRDAIVELMVGRFGTDRMGGMILSTRKEVGEKVSASDFFLAVAKYAASKLSDRLPA